MIKIYDMETLEEREILFRGGSGADVSAPVAEILRAVQERGDAALREYTLRFDGAAPDALAVTAEEVDQAAAQVEPAFLAVLEEAAEHIRAYHARQKRESFVMTEREGVVLGQRIIPLARVGIYVPGGTAAYPSTVLMNAIPARIAGVGEIIMVTPPGRDGAVNPHILAAAKIAGVTRIYKVGGAQAVAALAYGTGTIPQVDKIVGPGNAYVAEAKRQVFGRVNIDMIAGPSEVLVLADGRSNPAWVAADLLSQAEHDRMAAAVLVTDSRPLAEAVAHELERQLAALPRAEIARASLEANGKLIVCRDLREGIAVANRIAPEHLELCVDNPFDYLGEIQNAGSVFLGRYNPEPMGDYFAGPNHTLPTMGTARFYSPLSVDDFVKKSQFSYYTRDALARDYRKVSLFARKEGLDAHARAVDIRFEGGRGMIAIIDYGVGNLFSLKSSLAAIGREAVVTGDRAVLRAASHVILPGVGAFGDAAARLRAAGMAEAVLEAAAAGKPVLGICLGMQLLLERSFEYGEHPGLGLIPGEVRPIRDVIPAGLAVPHMGWNALRFPAERPRSPIFAALEEGEHVYFVHSYAGFACGEGLTAWTEYGAPLTAAVQRGNVYGTQFHPEKSGDVGLRILKAFCGLEG